MVLRISNTLRTQISESLLACFINLRNFPHAFVRRGVTAVSISVSILSSDICCIAVIERRGRLPHTFLFCCYSVYTCIREISNGKSAFHKTS